MRWISQLRRYLTVGLAATVVDFGLYGLLIRTTGITPVVANLFSRPVGGLVSFTGNKLWTFDRRSLTGTPAQLFRFSVTWLGAYATSEILVWVFSHHLGLGPVLTKMCAEAIACSGVFLTHRFWTFRAQR